MEFTVDNNILGIPVIQNQQEFIIGVFHISQILTFTKYTKRLIVTYDEDNMPIYNPEIQRYVEKSRVERIADFLINDPEATFPTNIVLHIPQNIIEQQHIEGPFLKFVLKKEVFAEVKKEQQRENTGDIFITIIDGQHRIKGIEVAIERLKGNISAATATLQGSINSKAIQEKLEYFQKRLNDLLNIQLVVSFFVDKTIEYQAMIFSTINRTQKRVSESLVYSLFGLTLEDSPQKTALQITLELNANVKSPFYNRIKLYGGEYDRNQSPPLSQATLVKSIVNLISENQRESENDRFRKRKELRKRINNLGKDLPFRLYYANNEDTKISDIFFYFFSAVRDSFIDETGTSLWTFDPESMHPTNILHTTVGYRALLDILVDILPEISEEKRFAKISYVHYTDAISKINVEDTLRYPFTNKTKSILYLDMSLLIKPSTTKNDPRVLKLSELIKDI